MALELEEIQQKITHIVDMWKPYRDDYRIAPKDEKSPEYFTGYRALVQDYEHIRYHSIKNVFPEALFAKRSPNQEKKEWEYQKDNYKQVTLPVYLDFLNVVGRSWNDGNWSIDYPSDEEGDPFQDYVQKMPKYGSLLNFVKSILTDVKMKDANGVVCVKPVYVPRNDDGIFLNGEEVDPIPYYYRVDQLREFKDNDYFIIELDEKSPVTYGNQVHKKGKMFIVIDDENIWNVTQVGKYVEFTFEYEVFFNHNIGQVPAKRLGGVPMVHEDEIYYQSPFLYAADSLDLAALNASNLQLSINNCVYPFRVMIGNVCDFEDDNKGKCQEGWLINNSNDTRVQCPSCHGSGLKSRLSPLGTLLIKPQTDEDPVGEAGITNPMQFVSPSTDTLTFLRDQIDININQARRILHIKDTTTVAQGGEDFTATGRAIDQKQMFTFIKPISDQLFDLYGFLLDAIGEMRYASSYESMRPSLKPSATFDFFTQDDYLIQISEAIKAGMPSFVLYPLYYKYLGTIFHTDNDTENAFKLIVQTDRLLTLGSDDIAAKVATGVAAKWEEVLHDSSVQLIKDLQVENNDFFTQDIEDQKQQLIDKAKETIVNIDESRGVMDTQQIVDSVISRDN